MKITVAKVSDLETILALQHHVFGLEAERVGNFELPALTQDMAGIKEDFSRGPILKAVEKGLVVGSVRGEIRDGSLLVTKLMVHPDARGRGVGAALMQMLEIKARNEHGATRSELYTPNTSEHNIRFYQKLGYCVFGEKPHHSGVTFALLEKDLLPADSKPFSI